MNKSRLAGILVGCFAAFVFIVTPVSAQTTEDQYRASLISLIIVLQQQIAELELQLAAQSVQDDARVSGVLSDIGGEVIASYTVDQREVSTRTPEAYRAYFDRLLTVLPDQYDDHIDELVIYTGGNQQVGAYVETQVPYTKDWRYGVRESEIIEDPASRASTELMVHEFAHMFSLDQVFQAREYTSNCHPYFADEICYGADTYIGQFVEEFWSTQMLNELQAVQAESEFFQTDFYDSYESEFVSEYAATDPAEDFAESFTWYVYGEMAPQGSIADKKIAFFDRFPYTQLLADEIQENI